MFRLKPSMISCSTCVCVHYCPCSCSFVLPARICSYSALPTNIRVPQLLVIQADDAALLCKHVNVMYQMMFGVLCLLLPLQKDLAYLAAGMAGYDVTSADATVAALQSEDAGGRFVGATVNKLFGRTMVKLPPLGADAVAPEDALL
jgi:hypothetical protein